MPSIQSDLYADLSKNKHRKDPWQYAGYLGAPLAGPKAHSAGHEVQQCKAPWAQAVPESQGRIEIEASAVDVHARVEVIKAMRDLLTKQTSDAVKQAQQRQKEEATAGKATAAKTGARAAGPKNNTDSKREPVAQATGRAWLQLYGAVLDSTASLWPTSWEWHGSSNGSCCTVLEPARCCTEPGLDQAIQSALSAWPQQQGLLDMLDQLPSLEIQMDLSSIVMAQPPGRGISANAGSGGMCGVIQNGGTTGWCSADMEDVWAGDECADDLDEYLDQVPLPSYLTSTENNMPNSCMAPAAAAVTTFPSSGHPDIVVHSSPLALEESNVFPAAAATAAAVQRCGPTEPALTAAIQPPAAATTCYVAAPTLPLQAAGDQAGASTSATVPLAASAGGGQGWALAQHHGERQTTGLQQVGLGQNTAGCPSPHAPSVCVHGQQTAHRQVHDNAAQRSAGLGLAAADMEIVSSDEEPESTAQAADAQQQLIWAEGATLKVHGSRQGYSAAQWKVGLQRTSETDDSARGMALNDAAAPVGHGGVTGSETWRVEETEQQWDNEGDAAAFLLLYGRLKHVGEGTTQGKPSSCVSQRHPHMSAGQRHMAAQIVKAMQPTAAQTVHALAGDGTVHAEDAMDIMIEDEQATTLQSEQPLKSGGTYLDVQQAPSSRGQAGQQLQEQMPTEQQQVQHEEQQQHQAGQQHPVPQARKVVVIQRRPANKYQHLLASAGSAVTAPQSTAVLPGACVDVGAAMLEDDVEDEGDCVPKPAAASGHAAGLPRNSGAPAAAAAGAMQVPNLRRPRLMGKQAGFKPLNLTSTIHRQLRHAAGSQHAQPQELDVIQLHSSDDDMGPAQEGAGDMLLGLPAGTGAAATGTQPPPKAVIIKRRRQASQPCATQRPATQGCANGSNSAEDDNDASDKDFEDVNVSQIVREHTGHHEAGSAQDGQQLQQRSALLGSKRVVKTAAVGSSHLKSAVTPWVYVPDLGSSTLQRFDLEVLLRAMETDKKIRCRPVHNASLLLHKLPPVPNTTQLLQWAQRAIVAQKARQDNQSADASPHAELMVVLEAAQKLMRTALEGDEYEQLRNQLPAWPAPPPPPSPPTPPAPTPSHTPLRTLPLQLRAADHTTFPTAATVRHDAAARLVDQNGTTTTIMPTVPTAVVAQAQGMQAGRFQQASSVKPAGMEAGLCDMDEEMDDAFWDQLDAVVEAATAAKTTARATPSNLAVTVTDQHLASVLPAPMGKQAADMNGPKHQQGIASSKSPQCVTVASVWDELMDNVGYEPGMRPSAAIGQQYMHGGVTFRPQHQNHVASNLHCGLLSHGTSLAGVQLQQVQQHHGRSYSTTLAGTQMPQGHRHHGRSQHCTPQAAQGSLVSVDTHWSAVDDSPLLQPTPQQEQVGQSCMRVFEDVLMEFDPGQAAAAASGDAQQACQKLQHVSKSVSWADNLQKLPLLHRGSGHNMTYELERACCAATGEAIELSWSSDSDNGEQDVQEEGDGAALESAAVVTVVGDLHSAKEEYLGIARAEVGANGKGSAPYTTVDCILPTDAAATLPASLQQHMTTHDKQHCQQPDQAAISKQAVRQRGTHLDLLESLPGCDILFDFGDEADDAQLLAAAEHAVDNLNGQQLAAAAAAMKLASGHLGADIDGELAMMDWEDCEEDEGITEDCPIDNNTHGVTQRAVQQHVATSTTEVEVDQEADDQQTTKRPKLQEDMMVAKDLTSTNPTTARHLLQQQLGGPETAHQGAVVTVQHNQTEGEPHNSNNSTAVARQQPSGPMARPAPPSVREVLRQRLVQEILRMHSRSKVDLTTLKSFLATHLSRRMAMTVDASAGTAGYSTSGGCPKDMGATEGPHNKTGRVLVHWDEVVSVAMQNRVSLFGELEVTPHRLFLALLSLVTQNNTAVMQMPRAAGKEQMDALAHTKLWLPGIQLRLCPASIEGTAHLNEYNNPSISSSVVITMGAV